MPNFHILLTTDNPLLKTGVGQWSKRIKRDKPEGCVRDCLEFVMFVITGG